MDKRTFIKNAGLVGPVGMLSIDNPGILTYYMNELSFITFEANGF